MPRCGQTRHRRLSRRFFWVVFLSVASCSSPSGPTPPEAEGFQEDQALHAVELGSLSAGIIGVVWHPAGAEFIRSAVVPTDRVFELRRGRAVRLAPEALQVGDSVRVWIRPTNDRGGLLRLSAVLRLRAAGGP